MGPGLAGSPNSNPNLGGRGWLGSVPKRQAPFLTLLDPTPRPVPSLGEGLGCSPGGRGEALRPRLPAAFFPQPGREETQEAAAGSRGEEGLGRASQPSGLRPRPARGGARGSGRRAGRRRLTHLGCQSFQLRGYLVPPPPLLSRDPGALRLITFPNTTWPSAAARRSASRRPNRPPPTLRSGPGLRRKPRRSRQRRAGEADGRSGFRLSPQRRTRRRERRGEREAEEGEATSLPGPYAARDAGAQEEEEEDGEEEAVATAPHAHTAKASPPPGSARRAAAAARHAGSEGRCRRPPGPGTGGGANAQGAGPGGRGKRTALPRSGLASTPGGQRQGPGPAAGAHGRGDLRYRPCTHTLPARPGKHLTLEGRAVRYKQASNQGPGVHLSRAPTLPTLYGRK